MSERPVLRALIAKRLADGGIGRSRVVSLGVAYLAMKDGSFFVIGPDPEDEEKLATWEREQNQINKPRWQQ